VVQRELRVTARRPLNHWLRLAGAGVGVIIFCLVTATPAPPSYTGGRLFNKTHQLLIYLICAFVPAITADCIARERREGTLGLLFMTPLTASGIVLGKILAQVLRAFTLWLAVLPVLTIPFIYGGLTWADVASFLIVELCVAMLCLAAGILASSLTENRSIAFILAFLLMGAFMGVTRQYQYLKVTRAVPTVTTKWTSVIRNPGGAPMIVIPPPGSRFGGGRYGSRVTSGGFGVSVNFVSAAGPIGLSSLRPPLNVLTVDFSIAAIILLTALLVAGWCVERSWQDKIPSVRRQNWIKRYCTPIFHRWFARRMQRAMERNPIAWLQQYSWKARATKWGLCLLFLLLECAFVDPNRYRSISGMLDGLLLILAGAYTYAGVNGFLQEKKTGALELILVSPIPVKKIIFGRAWGLWKQFLPAALLLTGSDAAIRHMVPYGSGFMSYYPRTGYSSYWPEGAFSVPGIGLVIGFELIAIYVMLPIIATYAALRFKNLFLAAACTWAVLLVPVIPAVAVACVLVFGEIIGMRRHADLFVTACFTVTIGNVLLAAIVFDRASTDLARRSYSF
jgi:ABC-type transport system involved in multi-copper enzyme maturation permease subunit